MKPPAISWAAMALAIACSPGVARAESLSPGAIGTEIGQFGPKRVVNRLVRDGRWETLIQGIASGDQGWIALAPRLAPGSDAGSAEELGIALALALPKAPEAVLAAIDLNDGPVLGSGRVCGIPFLDGTEPRDLDGYKRRALAALARVHGNEHKGAKRACSEALKRS